MCLGDLLLHKRFCFVGADRSYRSGGQSSCKSMCCPYAVVNIPCLTLFLSEQPALSSTTSPT